MQDQPKDMWTYWRDKYGHTRALENYYQELVHKNPDLQIAIHQIKANKALIDKFFQDADV